MKLKFKLLVLLLAVFTVSVNADEFTRDIHEAFAKSAIQSLELTNKYGNVEINDLGGDSVTVDVLITVDSSTEKKAEYLFDQIDISIRKNGAILTLETRLKEKFKTKQHFTIDYKINIPSDRDLDITNRYGNVAINELNAKGSFNIQYGGIHAGNLNTPAESPVRLNLAYSKADIESFNEMTCFIKYSKLYIGEAQKLRAESKYSSINAEELSTLNLESKYDGVKIEELDELRANSKYTNYNIEELSKSLVLNTEYGSVRVDEVGENFEQIDITNSYGGINIGLGDASYMLDANCDYCDIKVPEGSFNGNRHKENHHLRLEGTVGNSSSNSKVKITSRYGGVKLNE